jgi:hypothetical protein
MQHIATHPKGPSPKSAIGNQKSAILALLLLALPTLPSVAQSDTTLGSPWESRSAGIALRPPADSSEITRAGSGDEIVTFVDEKRNLNLVVSRLRFSQPVPLTTTTKDNRQTLGLLELTQQKLSAAYPDLQTMRADVINLGEYPAAMLATRLIITTESRRVDNRPVQESKLVQTAILKASDTIYYILEFTTPGAAPGTPDSVVDDRERFAVELFSNVLDSVKLLDQGSLRKDQEQRLDRTQLLFLNIDTQALTSLLVPRQYFRIVAADKDIGYTFFIEETGQRAARDGILIGVRSFTRPPTDPLPAGNNAAATPDPTPPVPITVTADSWMFASFDRSREEWSSLATIRQLSPNPATGASPPPRTIGHFGTSTRRVDKIVDPGSAPGEPEVVRNRETYLLEVTPVIDQVGTEPVRRDLPVFYFPQALGHLLPRIVAGEQKTFLFAVWVADRQEVMARYVDVLGPQDVKLAGRSFRANVIQDRIGLEGAPTYHYVSLPPTPGNAQTANTPYIPRYLGSSTPSARIEIVPADEATIRRTFPDADFSRPTEPERIVTRRKAQTTPKP